MSQDEMERAQVAVRAIARVSAGGDATAAPLELAFRRYSPYVATIALRLMGRDGDVDDVVQEVFLRAIKGLEQLREPEAIRSWLATVTVRVCRKTLRMRRLRAMVGFDTTGVDDGLMAATASPEQRALVLRLYRVLEAVPVDERIAWTLRYLEGEQLEAVAKLCGCSLATAKRRIAAVQQVIGRLMPNE